MMELPRIRLDPLGIEALDMRPEQDAIRLKYGPGYHLSDECLREVAAFWGINPEHVCINRHAFLTPIKAWSGRPDGAAPRLTTFAPLPAFGRWPRDTKQPMQAALMPPLSGTASPS